MNTKPHRPTTLQAVTKWCPHAGTLSESDDPRDRSIPWRFDIGTAAHEVLYTIATGGDVDALCERMITVGRGGDDDDGPLRVDDVHAGRRLAERWILQPRPRVEDGQLTFVPAIPAHDGALFEAPRPFNKDWTPTEWKGAYRRTRTDGEEVQDEGDEDTGPFIVVTVTDYKTGWQDVGADTDSDVDLKALDTLQRRFQAVAAALAHPEAHAVRMVVSNLRRLKSWARTVVLDEKGEALLAQWRADIEAAERINEGPRDAIVGARCFRCPFVVKCKPAKAYLEGTFGTSDPAGVARAWAASDAQTRALKDVAVAAVGDVPIEVDGLMVGKVPSTSRKPSPGLTLAAMTAFFGACGVEIDGTFENALRSWVAQVGEPGIQHARKFARAVPGVIESKWLEEHTHEVGKSRWGVSK